MSGRFAGWDERTLSLALDELSFGLAREDRAELAARADPRALAELELTLAELHVAALGELESPPPELCERIARDARRFLGPESQS